MGIIENENIICWDVDGKILCDECFTDDGEAKPLTREEINDESIVICDECGKRIQ